MDSVNSVIQQDSLYFGVNFACFDEGLEVDFEDLLLRSAIQFTVILKLFSVTRSCLLTSY